MHHALYQEPIRCERDGDEKELNYIVSTGITPAILVEISCESCNWTDICKSCLKSSKTAYAQAHKLITR